MRLLGIAVAVVAVVAAGVYAVGFTGLLGVRHVAVTGVRALSAEQVRAAAGVPTGQPLARLDTGAIAEHVRTLPGVERVAVVRSWPGTVRVTITERHGVAVVDRAGAYWLVDPGGVVFQRVAARPKLPLLDLTAVGADSPTATAALAALAALPPRLLAAVASVQAPTPEQVTLTLADERTVFWGGGEDSAAKAAVVGALLSRPGSYYDVSTPSVVTVR